ncbi:MAG: ABC transporter permease [Xanthobacteraceae bacterium]
MAYASLSKKRQMSAVRLLARNEGTLVITGLFILLLVIVTTISNGFGYYEFSFLTSGGAALALAAMGQALIILVGGFDLSVGASVSLINAILATTMAATVGSELSWGVAALAIGGLVGAVNGFFVAFLRIQSIVATLSTMFLLRGLALLVLPEPGGSVPQDVTSFFTGAAIPQILPAALVVILVAIAVWIAIKRTRFGTAIYAVGSDEESARAAGVRVRATKFAAFVIGGSYFGAAGLFVSAQSGAGDPLVGNPMLLETFAAVVLGGTVLGGGRGGCIGPVFGAYTLMLMVNILLVLNISAYYSTMVEGVILILAVLATSLTQESPIGRYVRQCLDRWRAWRSGILPSQIVSARDPFLVPPPATAPTNRPKAAAAFANLRWVQRNRDLLSYVLPSYFFVFAVVIVTQLVFGGMLTSWHYYNSLVVLTSFLAILALGQGAVILSGGLDLSVPWIIGLSGILATGYIHGSDSAAIWVVPAVLAVGALIGLFNGLGVVFLGLAPIVMTLATNGILQSAALVYSNGTPAGFSSPSLRWVMTGSIGGLTPVVILVAVFVVLAVLLLGRTAFGRRLYAVGNSARVATLSGVGVGRTLLGVYMLSGVCAALVGVLLTGFSGQASLGMGDEYLLPSIAVVVVGGTLITGGRGHYIGMLGGALLLTALQTLLDGTTLPHATRNIIFGVVLLGAVVSLRDRST